MGAAALLGLVSQPARGSAFDLADRGWEGCAGLFDLARAELGQDHVVAVARLDWSELEPHDGLLLIHPERPVHTDQLAAFLRVGGRVAVVDDFGAGNRILERFDIERVPPPSTPLSSLRHNPELAVAEPVAEPGDGPASGVHPILEGVDRLVTNHPSALRHPNLAPVLRIRAVNAPDGALGLAGVFGEGKLFAMGDPSVFINQMLRYPGNRAFAVGLVRYLVGDASGASRKGKLYIVANRFSETGYFGGVSTLKSEIESRLSAIEQDARDFATGGLSGPLGLALATALSVAVAAWIATRASRFYKAVVPIFSRQTPMVAQGGLAGRAAVLAASTTPRALVMLELKSALEEGLAHELRLEGPPSATKLLEETRTRAALDEPSHRALKKTLSEMAGIETLVAARQPVKVHTSDVTKAARTIFGLLAMVRDRSKDREAG